MGTVVTEVPSSLKQLARQVVRGFYSTEDALIIDMLVRNPCMKEDDIAELLRFEKKQMRSRITTLRNDKFIQIRLKMETGPDGKAQKVNYYFINYKTFVNVVKYKLDIMRKRMETEERDATSRASFKCSTCNKTFTDLEADQLFDHLSFEFHCTFCGSNVEEDSSAMPKKDSRLMLARFNEQLQPLYDLLHAVENVKLAPEILEPEPVDINTIRGITKPSAQRYDGQQWSGEATRNQGFAVEETRVNVHLADDDAPEPILEVKERPIWMTHSTIFPENNHETAKEAAQQAQNAVAHAIGGNNRNKRETEDILSVLLQYEKPTSAFEPNTEPRRHNHVGHDVDGYSDEEIHNKLKGRSLNFHPSYAASEPEDDNDHPMVHVCGRLYPFNIIDDDLIDQMTPQEKDQYVGIYQHHYGHMYD